MNENLMILPAKDPKDIHLLRVPDDFEEHEAFRLFKSFSRLIEEAEKTGK